MSEEIIKDELAERRKLKLEDTATAYGCGNCGFTLWHIWTDSIVTCVNCGATPNLKFEKIT